MLKIITYINTGNPAVLYDMVTGKTGGFSIDFINEGFILHRLTVQVDVPASNVEFSYKTVKIDKMDSYEKCVGKLEDHTVEATTTMNSLKKLIGPVSYRFAYPEIETSILLDDIDRGVFLKILHGKCQVSVISASDILKRNTDNIRNAVENDVFGSLPDDSLLDELEMGWGMNKT